MADMDRERPPRVIAPIGAADLAKRLRDATPDILLALGAVNVGRADWRFETRDETDIEWNGSELGPSTEAVWTMVGGNSAGEAVVRFETIRWSPAQVHRLEVLAHWRVAPRVATLFARAEGEAAITEVRADDAVWRSVLALGLPRPIR